MSTSFKASWYSKRRRFLAVNPLSRSGRWSFALFGLLTTGCGALRDSGAISAPSGGNRAAFGARVRPEAVRPEEAAFAFLAETAPSSAGYYISSDGELVVRVRDAKDDAIAIAAAANLVSSASPPSTPRNASA